MRENRNIFVSEKRKGIKGTSLFSSPWKITGNLTRRELILTRCISLTFNSRLVIHLSLFNVIFLLFVLNCLIVYPEQAHSICEVYEQSYCSLFYDTWSFRFFDVYPRKEALFTFTDYIIGQPRFDIDVVIAR